jgi:Periplasmic copper-binding protein (NosD)
MSISRSVLGILALAIAGTFLNAAGVLATTLVVANAAPCSANGLPPLPTPYTTIQSALNALPNATYATNTVVVCPGIYAEQLTITKNVTIRGAKLDGTDPVATFGNSNVARIVVPAGGLIAPTNWLGSFNVAAQVSAQGVTDVYLSNLTIDGTGIGCPVGSDGLPIRTAGIAFFNVGLPPGSDSKGNVNHVALQWQAGSCVGPSGNHLAMADGIVAENSAIRIDSNSITNIELNPIHQIGGVSLITGNYLNWCVGGGILLTNVAPIGANTSIITKNAVTVLYNAIYLNQVSGIQVTGNTLLSWTGEGIKLNNNSANNWIVSNTIADSAHAIYLLNGAAGNYVSGNTVVRAGEVAIVDWYPAGGNQITGNTISQANIGVFTCNAAGDVINPNVFYNVAALNMTGCNFVP